MVKFKINNKEVQGNKEDTIWKIAKSNGINIPHLCHSDEVGYKPDGNCRACVVQVKGERTLTASCIRKPVEGMEVTTNCDTAKESQKIILELLEADQPDRETHPDPDNAPSDGPNMVPLSKMSDLLKQLIDIDNLIKNGKN